MKMQVANKPVCDFCSGPPVWRYPAETFTEFRESLLPQTSEGDWLACDECAAYTNTWGRYERFRH
jgi:hypothetical protein